MQIGVTFTNDDAKKIGSYAKEKRLSMSASIRLLAIERINQMEKK